MGIDETASGLGIPVELPLAEAYRLLDARRIDLDRRMAALAPDDPARDVLWQELESVLAKLRKVVGSLAKTQANHLPELRGKAEVLASLLRAADGGAGPVIPEGERSALALSLTEDIARLAGG